MVPKGALIATSLPPSRLAALVGRLRAAGCVFAEDEAQLILCAVGTPADLVAMVDRRVAGHPLEHVLGWAEFCGLRIAVDDGVFVPRRRTEFLAREAVATVREASAGAGEGLTQPPAVVVDLCCGSGAVGAAIIAAVDRVELHATDIDPAAVACARRNVAAVGGHVYEGDLDEALPVALRGRVDVLIANAPYVPTESIAMMPPEARLHEPRVALDGGPDGLDVLRRVVVASRRWLAPGGHLLVETSARQAPSLVEAFAHNGLVPRVATCDELGATVVVGVLPVELR